MKVPILTYHANNINGREYLNNDHEALKADLQLLQRMGFNVITLDQLMKWYAGNLPDKEVANAVVLTCDDGTWFDYYDVDHPFHGHQTSFFNILKQHQQQSGQFIQMTNFVIVSPEARVVLDEKCLVGKGWWTDEWWPLAQQSGLMHISNHSWDHNHGVLENKNIHDDSFRCIDNKGACDQQIKQAQVYLQQVMGRQYNNQYFAYPYGNYSQYLRSEYLPVWGADIGLVAAFTTAAKHVTQSCDVWEIPRYVCNNDWNSTEQLEQILTQQ